MFNLSYRLYRSILAADLKDMKGAIPRYGAYKFCFEIYDRFNRGLHDRCWPYKRGSKGTPGENGKHHDFLVAYMLQNTFHAWISIFDH